MDKTIKKITALLCAAALAICCSGCGESTSAVSYDTIPDSTQGKDVVRAEAADNVFSLNSNPKYSFNPIIATNHSNQLICSLVYENMVEIDNDFNVHPNLILSWSCSDDGKSWIFDLDTSHTFHDGTPVTGRDLRYSLERAISSDRYEGRFASFQGASYTDTRLYVTLGIGDTQFIKLLNIPVVQNGTYGDDYPGGSGPYMYNEDHTQLLAYPGYVGVLRDEATDEEVTAEEPVSTPEGVIHDTDDEDEEETAPISGPITPPLDVIYIQEIQDVDGIISAFEDATIDAVINDPSSYTNLGYSSSNEIHTYATTNMHFVAFNEEGKVTSWPAFRAAMQYAFDRAYLVDLLQNNAVASSVPMYPSAADYPQELADSYDYNLDACMTVLENAGIRDYDEDGLREYMSGTPQDIELNFIVCSDSSAKAGVVGRFAADMASIGITVKVSELTWDEYQEALEKGEFDLYYGEVKLRNNFDLTELVQVRDIVDEDDTDKGNTLTNIHFSRTKDSMYESYVNTYLASTDLDRAFNFRTLCEYIFSAGGFVTIGFERQQLICHRGVAKNIDPNIGNPLYDFANWTIELD